jgi:hypothetical protein
MDNQPPITANELAEEAGLSSNHLDLKFRMDCDPHILAEFCDPWENIGYHLHLNSATINSIRDDNSTTENKRIATLQKWKQIFAHRATYRVLVQALIIIGRAQQALELCCKIKELRPASESDGASVTSRYPTTETMSLIDRDSATDEFTVPDVGISQSMRILEIQLSRIQMQFFTPETGIMLQQLQSCLSTLPSFRTDEPQALSLLGASSVTEFSHNLKPYYDALNPDILEDLIEVLGDVGTKSMMSMYIRALQRFQHRTKLKDFIGNYEGPIPPEYKKVQIKLGDNWREKTLADAKEMKCQISRGLMLVKMVSEDSVCVTFMIPQGEELELDIHLKSYLQSQGVLQISVCGICIFNCEGKFK